MRNSRLVVNAHDYPIIVQFTDGTKNHGHYFPSRGRVYIHNSLDITKEHLEKFPRLFDNKITAPAVPAEVVQDSPTAENTAISTNQED